MCEQFPWKAFAISVLSCVVNPEVLWRILPQGEFLGGVGDASFWLEESQEIA